MTQEPTTPARSDQSGRRRSQLLQERSRATRQQLIDAAFGLLLTQGFDETHVKDICKEAGVSTGTFHFYFSAKEDLLVEMAALAGDRTWEHWLETAATDASTRDVVQAVVRQIARRAGRTPRPLLSQIVGELFRTDDDRWQRIRGDRKDFRATFRALLRRGQERGEVPSRVDPDEAGHVLTTIVLQAQQHWARSATESLEELIWRRCEMVFDGLSSRGGVADVEMTAM